MLTMLVLMLQTTTLETDTAKAAMTCAQALTIADANSKSPMQLTSQFTHLAMQSVKAKPEGSFFEQLNKISGQVGKEPVMTPEQAKLLAPTCDRRFPLTRSGAPARLPTTPFRRDLLCFGTLSVLQGAAEEIGKSGDDSGLTRIKAAIEGISRRLTDDELKKQGFASEQTFVKAMGDEMLASLTTGNPLTVAAACGVTGI
jgi:hypothetical protein